MLISPAERNPRLLTLGRTSSIPEVYGADFLIHTKTNGVVGVQRKEIKDLVASVIDGRLQRELAQMKNLGLGVLLIEGVPKWTTDGNLLSTHSTWTRSQHLGLIWSVQSRGYWVCQSNSLEETYSFLSNFMQWLKKDRHNQLNRRPNANSVWGKVDNRDWGIHLLQSFPGIGYDRAANIYDHFGGCPLQWTVNEKELQQVNGIGTQTAQRLLASLSVGQVSQSSLGQPITGEVPT